MSQGFQDNFKRDSEEDMLDYDDSAFYYFSFALLTFAMIPYWYFTLKALFADKVQAEKQGKHCESQWFQDLLSKKKKEVKQSKWTTGLTFRLAVGLVLTAIWALNLNHVNSIEGLQTFDPYAILQLDMMADEKQIKKQYRKMSLQLHPDKNPDNPLAVQDFIRLTKAYNVRPFYLFYN